MKAVHLEIQLHKNFSLVYNTEIKAYKMVLLKNVYFMVDEFIVTFRDEHLLKYYFVAYQLKM